MHWTHGRPAGTVRVRRCAMLDNSVLAGEILRHGAYVCVRLADGADIRGVVGAAIPALAEKLGLVNEFEPAGGPPAQSIAYLRRYGAAAGTVADDGVATADAVVHVAVPSESVTCFECADADVPTFHKVCASLRDVAKNPEWKFVREGPTWHGRRVAGWPDLFTGRAK